MNDIEYHPFKPFIPNYATILIIGSFPGMEQIANKNSLNEWFYSAVDNLFWATISEAFEIELKTITQRKEYFTNRGIAITDIFTEVRRKQRSNRDVFLTDVKYNKVIKSIIEEFVIKKIFFTSKFVEKHFLKEFLKITFGISLPSPSPASNFPILISEEYKTFIETYPNANTKTFRIFKYKKLLS